MKQVLLSLLLVVAVSHTASAQYNIVRSNSYSNNSSYSTTLWNGGHKDAPLNFIVGYVNKQWVSTWKGTTRRENLFQEEGKRLHGVQIGAIYNPCMDFGLGFRTGLVYECYFSESPAVKDMGWDNFTEHDLYIPAHVSYRFPFTEKASLTVFGGIGFQWAMYGKYREWGHERYDWWTGETYYDGHEASQRYGNGWPKHVNWQTEAGLNIRIDCFTIGATYSWGLTDHEFYNECSTRQDKLSINIGAAF